MQIVRLCSAVLAPVAKAEMLVTIVNMRGDEERWIAARVCDVMSSRREPCTTQRSKTIVCARCASDRLGGGPGSDVEGIGKGGLNMDTRTGEVD
jgi:hypothetical protein